MSDLRKLITASSIGGAPDSVPYVTLVLDDDLSMERKLVAGTGISLVDGGANGTLTITNTGIVTAPTLSAVLTVGNTTGANIIDIDSTGRIDMRDGSNADPVIRRKTPVSSVTGFWWATVGGLEEFNLTCQGIRRWRNLEGAVYMEALRHIRAGSFIISNPTATSSQEIQLQAAIVGQLGVSQNGQVVQRSRESAISTGSANQLAHYIHFINGISPPPAAIGSGDPGVLRRYWRSLNWTSGVREIPSTAYMVHIHQEYLNMTLDEGPFLCCTDGPIATATVLLKIARDGSLYIGHDSPIASVNSGNKTIDIVSEGAAKICNYQGRAFGTGSFCRLDFRSARGTLASPTVGSVGDILAKWNIIGLTSTGVFSQVAAAVMIKIDDTPGTSGAPGRVEIHTQTSGGVVATEKVRITRWGTLIVSDDPSANISSSPSGGPSIELHHESGRVSYYCHAWGGAIDAPQFIAVKAGGTRTSPTSTSADDTLYKLQMQAAKSGGANAISAEFVCEVDGAPTATAAPSRFGWLTHDGTTLLERMRLDDNITAAETALLLSVAGAAATRVSVGAADTGGAGFRVLRVPN
mgnify:CR=1 FL=1